MTFIQLMYPDLNGRIIFSYFSFRTDNFLKKKKNTKKKCSNYYIYKIGHENRLINDFFSTSLYQDGGVCHPPFAGL